MSQHVQLLDANIHVGDWVQTRIGSEGRVVSVGRKTARIEVWTEGIYAMLDSLLSQLTKIDRMCPCTQ
jgi:preprotein translocase subunit YajC